MVLSILLLFAGLTSAESCPPHVRAIFDVGSGSTKFTLVEVEACVAEIRLKKFLIDEISLPVPLEASKDANGNITERGLTELTGALKILKERALTETERLGIKVPAVDMAVVATHAVRTAKNQAQVIRAVEKLGLSLVPLTQTEEARAGFAGVRAKGLPERCRGQRVLVWDVGGGSMEWTLEAERPGADPVVTGLPLGAETFKQHLIESLQLRATSKCASKTPNPIGTARMARAEAAAVREAAALKPFDAKNVCVVGIGGVHVKAIEARIAKQFSGLSECACEPGQTCSHESNTYSKREVDCLAARLSEKDDCDPEIRGPYSTTNVSNLFLISGLLRALHLDRVHTMDLTIGHGLATDQTRLKFRAIPLVVANSPGEGSR